MELGKDGVVDFGRDFQSGEPSNYLGSKPGLPMVGLADLRAGKCFVSTGSTPKVLRIVSVNQGVVRYEALKRKKVRGFKGEAAYDEFLIGIAREVGCDFEPATDLRIHV